MAVGNEPADLGNEPNSSDFIADVAAGLAPAPNNGAVALAFGGLGNDPADLGNDPDSLNFAPDAPALPPVIQAGSMTQAGSVVLVTTDFDAMRALAGVSADDWPDSLINLPMYLGGAALDAMRRIPCDWALLDAVSTQYLKLGLIYETASLIVPAANPTKTEDFKIGSFSLKTDDTALLGDAKTLMGWANQYYSNVVLPTEVLPLAVVDSFARPVIRKANTGRRKPFDDMR